MKTHARVSLFCAALVTTIAACGAERDDTADTGVTVGDTADIPAGSTVLVAIVNP